MSGRVINELVLEGLNCAGCAAKIEARVRNINGVENAYIDFAFGKLVLEVTSSHELKRITDEAVKIVKKIEPHVEVFEKDNALNEKQDETTHDAEKLINREEAIRLVAGAALFGTAFIFKFSNLTELILYFVSYILVGGEVLLKAVRNIARGQVFDENFLMSIATVGAFAIKEYPEGVAVMLFYQIGELFQDMAVNRSRKSIASLMDIRPDFANLKVGDKVEKVCPENVNIGDYIVIRPGERVPLDGAVKEGKSMVDTSALTGESVPRVVETGDEVLAGFINKNGLLTVEVKKKFGESTVSRILDLVQNASSKKAPTENFITKFARYYTPVVVFTALAIAVVPPVFIGGASFTDWLYRALIFLVISCPCALVVSIPLGFFGGIGGASKNGVLIKGGNFLEALNDVDTVVFDKTGTLTKGVFNVTEINPENTFTKDETLECAALAESYSNHPIAVSVLKAYKKEVDKSSIKDYEEITGQGVKVSVNGKEILAGNARLMEMKAIDYKRIEISGTVVHIAVDGKYAGYLLIADVIKEDSQKAINSLKNMGVKKTVMLTGDSEFVGRNVGEKLGFDEVYTELLPHQKVEKLEKIEAEKTSGGRLIFVGDGINDAPVLARADIGVAMGGLGSDAAIEAADVVLMTDEPTKLVSAIKIAKRTKRIVWQNIVFALGVKAVVLLLGAGGIATMWEAVFADVGVAVIAILNSMRAMKVEKI